MRISLIFAFLASGLLAAAAEANSQVPPEFPFRQGIKNFYLLLSYSGPQDKPFYSLTFTVQPIPSTAHDMNALYTPVSEKEAGNIIDALSKLRFFFQAADATKRPPVEETGYTLTVSAGAGASAVRRVQPLGFDLRMLWEMDELRKPLTGDAAKLMDQLLDRLSGQRKAWTAEGRVFARRGLAVLIKTPAPAAGQPVMFDVTLRNESKTAMTLPQDPTNIDRWNIAVSGPDGVEYNVARQGRAPSPPPGKSSVLEAGKEITFKLSMEGSKYWIQPKVFPAKMVGLDALPKGRYTFQLNTDFTEPPAGREIQPSAWVGAMNAAPIMVEVK